MSDFNNKNVTRALSFVDVSADDTERSSQFQWTGSSTVNMQQLREWKCEEITVP